MNAPSRSAHLCLQGRPSVRGTDVWRRLRADHDRFARIGLPSDLERYLHATFGLDVRGSYAGHPVKNPWGKGSGQLSMRTAQIEEAAAAGLGFVVLKTVIAQDDRGCQSMAAWAVRESRMVAEPIIGKESGEPGWTVSWKGRGWWQSFGDYLTLVRESAAIGRENDMIVAPSVKYHLPGPDESGWRTAEYDQTTRAILEAYRTGGGPLPMPIEKDFSPTLAGSDRSRQRPMILEWLMRVPTLIRNSVPPGSASVGLKMFNSLEDEGFQSEMLARVHEDRRADFLVYANRLFDPDRTFDGQRGIAFGGPDLSARNLRALSRLRAEQRAGRVSCPSSDLEISGTGDISSGRMAMEYALRGCTSFQLHTLFQLPADEFAMKRGNKVERALHRLYFDLEDGLIVWLLHVGQQFGLEQDGTVRLSDVSRGVWRTGLPDGGIDA